MAAAPVLYFFVLKIYLKIIHQIHDIHIQNAASQTLPVGKSLSEEKKKNVDNLLQAVFENWQKLDELNAKEINFTQQKKLRKTTHTNL